MSLLSFEVTDRLEFSGLSSIMANQPKGTKHDFSRAILERKKAPNRLLVDEATNDDNSIVAIHADTMEKL
ncbi:hypothetical protein Tco_0003828 [Tanacetum coccineum]